MNALQFRHSRRGVFQINEEALATMRGFEQHAHDALEAGGLLLGRYIRGGHDIVVDRVTTPGPNDKRTRFGFYRDAEPHATIVSEAWQASGGTCNAIGDWHTHAEPVPTPSRIDLDNWKQMLREEIRDNEACFFVIVGQRAIRVWEGDHSTGEILECLPIAVAMAA